MRIVGRLDGDDVADLAFEDLFHGLATGAVVSPAEAIDQGEVLLLGGLAGVDELSQAGPVHGHRLLDEGVDPLLDGVSQVDGPELRRRRQEDEVDLVDDVLVAVEAGVLAVLGDVDARTERRAFEAGEAIVEPILEGVGHGDELGVGVGGERLLGRAAASATTADEPDLDRVAAGGMDQGSGQASRERRGCRRGRALQEVSTGGSRRGGQGLVGGIRR